MNKLFGLFAAATLTLGFAACSSEEPLPASGPGVLDVDKTCYMKVAISGNPDLTRSAVSGDEINDYDKGTTEENMVDKIYLVFYDTNGNITASGSPSGGVFEIDTEDNKGWTDGDHMNVSQLYQTVVKVDLNKGEGIPAYVMCYVNPFSADYIRNNSLTALENNRRNTEVYIEDKGKGKRFPMNNSVYYGSDIYQDGENVLVRATPVPVGALKESREEALDDKNIVEIYVDRVGAKLSFTHDEAEISDVVAENDFTLSFQPEFWTLNADEKEYFLTKSYRDLENEAGGYGSFNLTYAKLIDVLGPNNISSGNWKWNNSDYFRSYWACSPGYFSTKYPQVSDDVIYDRDEDNNPNHGEFTLKYKSYSDIVRDGWVSGQTQYVRENTVGKSALAGANANIPAALPSVVVVGKYTLKLNGTTITDDGNTPTFYNYAGRYVEGKIKPSLYFTDKFAKAKTNPSKDKILSIVDAMAASNFKVLIEIPDASEDPKKATHVPVGQTVNGVMLVNPNTVFEVKHPDADVRGNDKINERYVALQLKSGLSRDGQGRYQVRGSDGKLYFLSYVNDEGKYLYIKDAAPETDPANVGRLLVNQRLVMTQGFAEAYATGHAFFNIPVQHLRPGAKFGDYEEVEVGQYGIVRNHSYNIKVNKIEGLGTGIENLEHPIVPNKTIKDYFIGYKVNVLNWRVVPTQNVDL